MGKPGPKPKYDDSMTEFVILRMTPLQKFALQKLADDMSGGNISDFIREHFTEAFEDWREDYEAWKKE